MEHLLRDASLSAVVAALTGTPVLLHGSASALRDQWLILLQQARRAAGLEFGVVRIPANVEHERLLGGLDLSATLAMGKPIYLEGLLTSSACNIVCLSMAERWETATTAIVTQSMDNSNAKHTVIVAQDESQVADDQKIAMALHNRLGVLVPLHLIEQLPGIAWQLMKDPDSVFEQTSDWVKRVQYANLNWRSVTTDDQLMEIICQSAQVLGVDSTRALIVTARAAKVIAAIDYRDAVNAQDVQIAVRLGLVWRATRLPQSQDTVSESKSDPVSDSISDPPLDEDIQDEARDLDDSNEDQQPQDEHSRDDQLSPEPLNLNAEQLQAMQDTILEAALSTLPPEVLSAMVATAQATRARSTAGSSGAKVRCSAHGKKRGSYRTKPSSSARLDVLQTLRAAAPWQAIRSTEDTPQKTEGNLPSAVYLGKLNKASTNVRKIHIRKQDFRYPRIEQQARSTMIFVVDASGSSALNRLAEAKGTIEILLGQCYIRRDQVCMVSFRGNSAELSLPVTRSLARAKRSLNGLPGGGGTPIALGLDLAISVAKQCQQRGETAFLILLTDGKANVTRAGTGGRSIAHSEALAAAQAVGSYAIQALLLDTSTQANPLAQEIALSMKAKYIALPYAGAIKMAAAVNQAGFVQMSAQR